MQLSFPTKQINIGVMKCCWCQQKTEDKYLIKRNPRKPLSGVVLPVCRSCKERVVGSEALPVVTSNKPN